ncbi:MAG: SUMF1/EgtB/PvdO family nonheme iron enzyme [Acidobacteriia bacterium]|nr:SUMF1/EgtB/PvdO family nonheme iron enzyme [Terriglobia bacterium]
MARSLPRPWAAFVVAVALLGLVSGWSTWNDSRRRAAREATLPEAIRLAGEGSYVAAFDLAQSARRLIPSEPALLRLLSDVSRQVSFETVPQGARVSYKEYSDPDGPWRELGATPVRDAQIPRGFFRWRIEAPGYAPVDLAASALPSRLALHRPADVPGDMVYVPAGVFMPPMGMLGRLPPQNLPEYWIDRFEVTNGQFGKFVEAGGYRNPDYWKYPFERNGGRLTWDEAVKGFVDSTGRPGPSTWEAGACAPGKQEFPVSGVSWYEAAAYAEFARKRLPTYYQWHRAAGAAFANYIVPLANLDAGSLAAVGAHPAISPAGAYDMAGNVREWTLTERSGQRFILGGAWNDPPHAFPWPAWRSPWDRSPGNGIRTVRYARELTAEMDAPLQQQIRDPNRQEPAADERFEAFRRMYARKVAALDPRIESADDSSPLWTRQIVSYATGMPQQRMSAMLVLPKNGRRPLQTVVYYPGARALSSPNLEAMSLDQARAHEFLIKSGRAMVFPAFWGMYERRTGLEPLQHGRTAVTQWVHDLGATLDYLAQRPEFDGGRIAYLGESTGARMGTILLPLEERIRVAVLLDGGVPYTPRAPEADELNFAPRVRIPTLMVNGRYDPLWPPDMAQEPLFRLLGPPEKDKKWVLVDAGAGVLLRRGQVAQAVLDWLDRYLGPAK